MLERRQGKSKAATGDVVSGAFLAEFVLTIVGFRYISLWRRRNPKLTLPGNGNFWFWFQNFA